VNTIGAEHFDFLPYREVAVQAITFYREFKAPPLEHIADLLADKLSNPETAKIYSGILENLFMQRESVNEKYVLSRLKEFVRLQSLKSSVIEAAKYLQEGDTAQAELVLEQSRKVQINTFEPGIGLFDPVGFLHFLVAEEQNEKIEVGIPAFDMRGIAPKRKEFFLFMAAKKMGKSWWLIHLAKQALLQRKKVLIVSLEMSEDVYARRLVQSFFSYTIRDLANIPITLFNKDNLGRALSFSTELLQRPSFTDTKQHPIVLEKLKNFASRHHLIVKQFPTSRLNMRQLEAYLDMLEREMNFTPDLLVIDYMDLMELDTYNLRLETGQLYKSGRGLAVDRNFMLASASQGNRESEDAKLVTARMIGEDWSKTGTVDTLVTYSQTAAEYQSKLARLFVAAARSEEDKFTVLVSQAYQMGQFVIDSAMMTTNYWQTVDTSALKQPESDAQA
jgi:KaiC/GvpD/RAD55 family RecA-like ATPase